MPDTLQRTPLFDRHVALGGRIVPFAGFEMPVQYAGVIDEVRAVRTAAGIFDVSHMGQLIVGGEGAHAFLQAALSNDLDRIEPGGAQYTLLPNESGGIVDDLIAYRRADGMYMLVVNASNIAADLAHLEAQLPGSATLRDGSHDHAMIALQGPDAGRVLEQLGAPLPAPFTWVRQKLAIGTCTLAGTGYTGEPGCELICEPDLTGPLWDALIEAGATPCGLGARDALRLEVCYPLHGNDITPETDAIEAGLGWVCALAKDFTGAEALRRTKERGPARKLVALRALAPRSIPRAGCELFVGDEAVGTVTSGTFSPTLELGIGLGYVDAAHATPGTRIDVDVRGRRQPAEIATKPLYRKEQ